MDDLLKGNLGKEASYDVDLKDGKISINLEYKGAQAGGRLGVDLSLDLLLDKLSEKSENQLVKSLVGVLKLAVKVL